MLFKGKREPAILCVLAAALGVFLVANAGTLAAGRSPVLMHAAIPLAANPGVDSACQAVLDASEKLYATPFHMYSTQAGALVGNGKPTSSEMISTGGTDYVLYAGKWTTSSTAERKAMSQGNQKNAKNMSCHYVRDELVNGESAALYSTHEESAHGKTDSQNWVSKSKGLILRQEIDIDTGGAKGKSHMTSRYEYSNVQAPKL
ncbi:MAG: hypothetical protein ACLQVG_23205 [Terriglobia bacterium]